MSPPPQAQENIARPPPLSSASEISLQVPLPPFHRSCGSPPPRKRFPLPLHQIPTCPLEPSQFTVGTADDTPFLCAHNLGPKILLAPRSPNIDVPRAPVLGSRGTSEGTARLLRGQQLLAPPHTLSLGCWGWGGGPCGDTANSAPGIQPSNVPTAGSESESLPLEPTPPGLG